MLFECEYPNQWTIIDAIRHHVESDANSAAFTFIDEHTNVIEQMSYKSLYHQILYAADALNQFTLHNQTAILMLQNDAHFIRAFLSCIYLGCISVPIPPPQGKRHFARFKAIIEQSNAKFVITHSDIVAKMNASESELFAQLKIKLILIDKLSHESYTSLTAADTPSTPVARCYQEIAFLQYTSGSTAAPKGVVVTHKNIYTNQQQITKAFKHDKSSIVVGWLPFYHDMGLIGNILQPLFTGIHSILFSPSIFLNSPKVWLQTISKYKATTSGGPNFAYQHCINKINKNEIQDIDLKHWKTAFNGAEMINPDTLNKFAEQFSDLGFKSDSLFTCYGMAEATLFVTGKHYTKNENIQSYVNCGHAFGDTQFHIVDPATHELCPDETIGEIWLAGNSIAAGYWQDEANTQALFQAKTKEGYGPFLRTGDLGFCKNASLYVTGRIKELMIVRGRNYSPFDIEVALKAEVPELLHTRMAVIHTEAAADGQAIILVETGKTEFGKLDTDSIYLSAQAVLAQQFQLELHAIVFVRTNTLPRTTSGKLQYYACRDSYINEKLYTLGVINKDTIKRINTSALLSDETEITNQLRKLVSAVLGYECDQINPAISLIHYGIDSLKAIELVHAISKVFDHDVKVEEILSSISINDLLIRIQPKQTQVANTAPSVKNVALTSQQQSIWLWQKLNPDSQAYVIPMLLDIEGQYDCQVFKSALTLLANKHPILKAKFVFNQGIVEQHPDILFEPVITITESQVSNPDALLSTIVQLEGQQVIQLDNMPAWRVHIIKISENQCKLLLVFHHIIIDGWSVNILVRDFISFYQNKLDAELTSMHSINYFDYAHQQKQIIHDVLNKSEAYWLNYIGDNLPVYNLTHYQNRQKLQGLHSSSSHYAEFSIDSIKANALRVFAKKHHVTLTQVLLALYHILLHQHSSENKTLIGYPNANRSDSQFAETIGCFVNTLVNKAEFNKDVSILEVIRQVKTGLLNAIQHESYPFQSLVKALHIEKHKDISPVFQCFFVLQNAHHHFPDLAGLKVNVVPQPAVPAMYDLVLEVRYEQDNILGKFEFNESIPKELISYFIEYYSSLLDIVLNDPETKVSNIHLHESSFELPETRDKNISSVVELVENQAKVHPSKVAIQSDAETWTYQLLNEKAAQLAAHLHHQGIRKGDHVMLAVSRSPWMIAALFAIQKAGAVYVPVDLHYPDERLRRILQLCQPKAIIYDQALSTVFESIEIKVSTHHITATDDTTYLWTKGKHDPDSPAYIITTSGTSGEVKGVVVNLCSLINFTLAAMDVFEITEADKVLQFSSLSWDTSSEEIYPALARGACLVLRSTQPVETYANLIKLIQQHQVTVCDLPSSYWQELFFYLRDNALNCPESLRLIIVGGEPVSLSTLTLWYTTIGDRITILNTYGSTEATSISAACSLNDTTRQYASMNFNIVPIGKPIAGVKLHILDDNLNPVLPGVSGQLYIGGQGVAKGYLHNDALSEKKFVYLTNSDNEVERVFATGDLAFYSLEKDIFLLGRNDNQIKRRGIRIQLSEIETILLQHPLVANVVMQVKKDKHDIHLQKIIAYVVLKDKSEINKSFKSINEYLQNALPRQYLPDHIEIIHTIPKLTNGKIDYNRLVEFILPYVKTSHSTALSKTESELQNIWMSLLGINNVDKSDNYFDVGGNSFALIHLHQQLESLYAISMDISELFTHATIESQAQYIDSLLAKNINNKIADQRINHTTDTISLLEKFQEGKLDAASLKVQLGLSE